jgi:hypothetical protein
MQVIHCNIVKGVVIFASDQEVAGVMRAVHRKNATERFTWIGSDGWSARALVSDGNERAVEGTLSVQPRANEVKGFKEYFLNLSVHNNKRNPWFVGKSACTSNKLRWGGRRLKWLGCRLLSSLIYLIFGKCSRVSSPACLTHIRIINLGYMKQYLCVGWGRMFAIYGRWNNGRKGSGTQGDLP